MMQKNINRLMFGVCLLFSVFSVKAQLKVGDNPNTMNTNSILEVEATNKGVLLPRVSLAATNSASPLSAHVAGMLVYNNVTASSGTTEVTPGYYYNNGSKWVRIVDASDAAPSYGDIKSGFQTNDHNGWILLDGRNKSSLNARQQVRFTKVYASTYLPKTTGGNPNFTTYLADINGQLSSVGGIGGNVDNIWIKNDLPKITHLHSAARTHTSYAGHHRHDYSDTYRLRQNTGVGPVWNSNSLARSADPHGRTTTRGNNHRHSYASPASTNPGGANTVPTHFRTLDVNHFIYLGL